MVGLYSPGYRIDCPAPFANMSITGFLWYQGENNCGGTMGNSVDGIGYGCELIAMVESWRDIFNNPTAAFGTVTLAAGGSEGNGQNMAGMRWSQTANYGTLPAPNLPYSFLAQAFDLGDPMDNLHPPCYNESSWNTSVCIWPPASAWNDAVRPLAPAVWENKAPSFMGGIHPRFKLEVGRRLAVAAYNLLFGGQAAHTGPTISGCTASGTTITVQFNSTLLNGDSVLVQPFDTNVSNWSMKDSNSMAVCIGDPSQILDCLNDTTLWVPASLTAGSSGNAVVATAVTDDDHVDGGTGTSMHRARVGSNGTVLAIKYGWPVGARGTDSCCPTVDVGAGHMPCVPGSCPLITKASSLPANPFLAFIVDNKCQCMAPQVCSE
eukprot:m.132500 g.132500  ORF g.132500 m.132500 type:complete len:378 (+) comp11335_c0_seq2:1686-2819(+)